MLLQTLTVLQSEVHSRTVGEYSTRWPYQAPFALFKMCRTGRIPQAANVLMPLADGIGQGALREGILRRRLDEFGMTVVP